MNYDQFLQMIDRALNESNAQLREQATNQYVEYKENYSAQFIEYLLQMFSQQSMIGVASIILKKQCYLIKDKNLFQRALNTIINALLDVKNVSIVHLLVNCLIEFTIRMFGMQYDPSSVFELLQMLIQKQNFELAASVFKGIAQSAMNKTAKYADVIMQCLKELCDSPNPTPNTLMNVVQAISSILSLSEYESEDTNFIANVQY